MRNFGEALTNVAIHSLLREPFRQLPQCQLNSAYASFRYRQSPNEKKQTNFCLHASMTQSLPVLFVLLVASLNLYLVLFVRRARVMINETQDFSF